MRFLLLISLTATFSSSFVEAGDLARDIGGSSELPTTATRTWTDAQRQEMQLRSHLAEVLVNQVAADAERKHADAWRQSLMTLLYQMPSRSLQAMEGTVVTLDDAIRLANATLRSAATNRIKKDLGSVSDSLVFTPITPCRYIDTRNYGGPIIAPRDFSIALTGASYGGNGGCQVPGNADAAIAINVTIVVPPGRAGFLGLRPFGDTSKTSFINWLADGTTGTANAGIIATAPNAEDANAYTFEAFASTGNSPELVVDVFGYFAAPGEPACLYAFGETTQILGGHSAYIYSSVCNDGYRVSTGGCQADNFATQLLGFQQSGEAFECTYYNSSSSPQAVTAFALCCKGP